MKREIRDIVIAAALWLVMFSQWTAPYLNFWAVMSASALILIFLSRCACGPLLKKEQITLASTIWGMASAAILWGIFWVGNYLAIRWFGFAQEQIGSIYAMKNDTDPRLIAALLLILIGPAEEIFWRGYIQERMQRCECLIPRHLPRVVAKFVPVVVTTLVYSLVHIWSFNFMLVMSAMVCGAFWGLMYKLSRGNLWMLIVSHALWDAAVFVIFPIS